MHTFVSLEIGSEQSGRRLGGWNGIIIQPFVQRISILVPDPADHILVPEAQCNGMDHPALARSFMSASLHSPGEMHIGKCSNVPVCITFGIFSQFPSYYQIPM